jgi:putative Flp pilus-assembly TadE/G-like protein
MKPSNPAIPRRRGNRQAGQTTTLVLLALGLFLLGAVGLAVDVSNWWFHRQMAQGAADAACTAGVMDLLSNASSGGSFGNFPNGSPPAGFSCSSATTSAVCKYAALNGYAGAGLTANTPGDDVEVSFPSSVPGLKVCGPTNPPPCIPATTVIANPFIEVVVRDRVQTSFTGLLSGSHTADVAGSAVCGVLQATAPVPIIVMNPSCQHAFELSGNSTVQIVGGPTRSVQVNSSNTSCAAATSNAGNQCNSGGPTIDLSQGGPNFSGSEFSVTGLPPPPGPTGFTGSDWTNGAPISDPYALVSAPTKPAASPTDGKPVAVLHNIDGCPDTGGCLEYQPGLYTNAIVVKGVTAIFVPGIYYLEGTANETGSSPGTGCVAGPKPNKGNYALDVDQGGIVRPASNTAPNSDGSNGVMFYLTGSGGAGTYSSVFFGSNAGKRTIDPFVTANATCTGGTAPPAKLNLPTTTQGDVLLGQCTNKGTYIGAGSTDTSGVIRGLIFFQDRADADASGQPEMHAGGGLVLSGNMYFHNCRADGTGVNCSAPLTGYNAFFNLQGSPGNSTYVLGNITTDELVMGGGGTIAMSLNPNAIYNILKASLLQ